MEQDFVERRSDGFVIDYKRIAYQALRYWHLVAGSFLISIGIAYVINRYAERVYSVASSLIIKEKDDISGAEFLYSNPLLSPYRNYLNEPYLVRSYPVIGSVINKLNFDVAFFKEGNIKTSEAYNLPVMVRLLRQNGSYGASLNFIALDEQRFSVSAAGKEEKNQTIFHFNDSIEFRGHHFIVLKEHGQSISRIRNERFILTFLNPIAVAGSYIGRLNVAWAEEGSGVLNLSITGSNPTKEIDFMNGLIAAYQTYDLEKKNLTAERTIQFIKEQLKEISDSLKIFEGQLLKYKIQNSSYGSSINLMVSSSFNSSGNQPGINGSTSGASGMSDDVATRLYSELKSFESQKTELIVRANYFNYLEKTIRENNNLDLMVLPAAMGIQDDVLSGLVGKVVDIQLEVKLQLEKKLNDNPLVQNSLERLREIKGYLIEAINELRVADKFKEEILNQKISELEKQIGQLPVELREFITVQRTYSLLESLYVFLIQKMSEAAISKASSVSDIMVVNPPMQGALISPSKMRNYMLWGGIGLFIPLGIFALIELLNQKVQSKEDIDRISSIPFIGGIWHYSDKNNLAVSLKPKSAVAESFRAIRSNLNFFTGNQAKKVFMISSSVSGEGKTFSTINLATVFAMSGRRTLIIGADMRKPKIYSDFDLSNERGLSGYLSHLNDVQEVIQHTPIENLDLISAGPVPPNPSELLLTNRFEELIKEALKTYDYIIVDTPPLAIVTDAFVLAKFSDHTVFVVRQNYTQKAFLRDIQDFYSSGKLKNISIVLNDIYKTGLGYGYGYGYGYRKKQDGDGYYS